MDGIRHLRILDQKMVPWRALDSDRPHRGWLRAVRDALGLTTRDLAARLGTTSAAVTAFEQREVEDAITLASLRRVAAAMDCRLVYALVPEVPLEDMVRTQAAKRADEAMARVGHTMDLEAQGVPDRVLQEQRQALIDQLIRNGPKGLWTRS